MPKYIVKNVNEIVNLFENGHLIVEIARRYGISKQAVSARLKRYYFKKRPRPYLEYLVHKTCIVCGCEEINVEKKVPYYKLNKLQVKPIIREKKFLCSLCDKNNLYKCYHCKAIGHLGGSVFVKGIVNVKTRKARCRDCNLNLYKKWKNNNKKKIKYILKKYYLKRKKRTLKEF